jgi:hypothetical protein
MPYILCCARLGKNKLLIDTVYKRAVALTLKAPVGLASGHYPLYHFYKKV